jgi:outer membrane lipoprotein-sorting protein
MNCQECQDELTAYLEGLLDEPRQSQIDLHVAECVACQAELQAVRELTVRLARHGLAAPAISLETAVMDRILHDQALQLRRLKMRKRLRVLGFSGVTAAAIAIVFVSSLWFAQPAEAQKAVEVMAQGAKAVANPSAVHIMAKMRTLPYDNFSMIGAEYEFVPIEIWKQFNGKSAWRVEKPGRVIVMDGATTEMLIRPDRLVQLPMVTQGAFNSGWLLALTRVQDMVNHELRAAQKQGWDINLTHETTAAGAKQLVVTVEAKSGLPADDYLQNKSLEDADMRRVYRFNAETKRLEGFEAHLHHAGSDVLILAIESIEYDKKIDPTVFALQLPEKVTLIREPGPLPDNEKYQKMTPKEAATTFFEACGKEDWTEVEKFYSSTSASRTTSAG